MPAAAFGPLVRPPRPAPSSGPRVRPPRPAPAIGRRAPAAGGSHTRIYIKQENLEFFSQQRPIRFVKQLRLICKIIKWSFA